MLWWGAQERPGSPEAPSSPWVWDAVYFCTSGRTVGSDGMERPEPVSPRALPRSGFPAGPLASWLRPSLTSLGPLTTLSLGPAQNAQFIKQPGRPPTPLDPRSTHCRPPGPVSALDWPLQGAGRSPRWGSPSLVCRPTWRPAGGPHFPVGWGW